MSSKHYDFRNGPGIIQQHSIAKHRILESYLAAYFQTLGSSPNQDVLRLTLVDGFAGGGQYIHADTRELVFGSPFICLNAVKEAGFLLNRDRRKPLALDVSYFFIEADRNAHAHLEQLLRNEGHGSELGKSIYLRHAKFQSEANEIIAFVKKRSPKNGRSIFVLDQYGYKDVPTPVIRTIFANLPSAEVILTFGVDSFLNFASDASLTGRLLDSTGLNTVFRGMSVQEIKQSEREWRLFIQACLYRDIVEACGARYYTPFFIRNNKGHGDYWLIHMSQHHRARDVMTEVHWKHNNYFIHYGGAGLDMFNMVGYDPDRDAAVTGQFSLGFEFDDVAHSASVAMLMDQIAHLIHSHDQGMSFGELFATTCNSTPASAAIYRDAIERLIEHKAVEAVSVDGVQRRSAQQVHDSDRIRAPTQKVLFL